MRTITDKKEFCECCGIDFTRRAYADKIAHSNKTNNGSVDIHLSRFKDAKTKEDQLYEILDMIDIDSNHVGFKVNIEILNCLVKKYRHGFEDRNGNWTTCEQLAEMLECSFEQIKEAYNNKFLKKIKELEGEIEYNKSQLIKSNVNPLV